MNKKGTIILEYVWFILTVLSAIIGSYKTATSGIKVSYIFFIISAVAAFMYILRRAMRKYTEKNNNKK